MKTVLAYTLSALLLAESMLPAVELPELWKLPALMEHYAKHKVESPDIDFISFLRLHYDDASHHKQDPQAHHELPFGSHSNHEHTGALQAVILMPSLTKLIELVPLREINKVICRHTARGRCAISIWQPPRNA
ncbi:MAG: hypothetical protein HC859_12360 [Bacteroidia bacterium]|nr:hypothetical protein [Bacteroidia bacterium]